MTRKTIIAATLTTVHKDEQWSVNLFLVLENVLDSEIHTRMCMVYSLQNVTTKSAVNPWVWRFKVGWTTSDKPRMTNFFKKKDPECYAVVNDKLKNASLGIAIMLKSKL